MLRKVLLPFMAIAFLLSLCAVAGFGRPNSEPVVIVDGSSGYRFRINSGLQATEFSNGESASFAVNYPEMTSRGAGAGPGEDGVAIWLSPYKANNLAKRLLAGEPTEYKPAGTDGIYKNFTQIDKQTGSVATVSIFHDSKGNLVWFEDPGSWSHDFRVIHGDPGFGFSYMANVSKNIKASPALIDQKITGFIEKMAEPK